MTVARTVDTLTFNTWETRVLFRKLLNNGVDFWWNEASDGTITGVHPTSYGVLDYCMLFGFTGELA
jgi:hypothetical protein